MFPGPLSWEEEVCVSVTVHVCREEEKERVEWAFLFSLQEHKGQSNTSSGAVAKTANLAQFLLLYFTICSLFLSLSHTSINAIHKSQLVLQPSVYSCFSYLTNYQALSLWMLRWKSCLHACSHGGIPRRLWRVLYGSQFIRTGRKLVGCFRLSWEPSCYKGSSIYRHQPPHKVICVGVFILGA